MYIFNSGASLVNTLVSYWVRDAETILIQTLLTEHLSASQTDYAWVVSPGCRQNTEVSAESTSKYALQGNAYTLRFSTLFSATEIQTQLYFLT